MITLVRYHTYHKVRGGYESAVRSALIKHGGRKWLYVVALDATTLGGIKLWKVPLTDAKYMQPLLLRGKPYPMARALKTFRSLGKTHGITKGAMKIIKEATREDKERKNVGRESPTETS